MSEIKKASMRDAYGKTLAELSVINKDIVVLDADLSKSTRTNLCADKFPDRFFNVGIAEQNMIGIAAGLAAAGKTVFASSFAVFAPGRCFDQMRLSVAQPSLNVKVVATHGGLTVGEDGASHQAIEDLALASVLPGFHVVVPADAVETAQVIRTAANIYGPFYIRLSRIDLPIVYQNDFQFILGKASLLCQGKDVTIIAVGVMVAAALNAAEQLQSENISCRVLNMSTLKPIDEQAIIAAARETGAIVTAEEHQENGGLGSMVARIVTRNKPVPMSFVAVKDSFGESGKPDELLKKYGLTASDIVREVYSVISRK